MATAEFKVLLRQEKRRELQKHLLAQNLKIGRDGGLGESFQGGEAKISASREIRGNLCEIPRLPVQDASAVQTNEGFSIGSRDIIQYDDTPVYASLAGMREKSYFQSESEIQGREGNSYQNDLSLTNDPVVLKKEIMELRKENKFLYVSVETLNKAI